MTAVQFDHVTLAMARREILADVSLTIDSREFVGLLGPNGSGKTTLLRAIMGLIPVASGHISVFGNPAVRGNPAIGYMPQLRSNFDALRLSGWDFVASVVNGHRLGLPILAREARDDVERALDLVEARDLARRPLMEISGGERQRLLLAQALIGRPRLLLLDEPLISLDPRRQQSVVALVKRVQAALAIPVVFSSHELNPLLGTINRVLYLGNGHAAIGTVDEVITSSVLSKLYGSPISVVRLGGRIFVLSGEHEVERDAHRHEHNHAAI
jgi:zinc/manganese transport system ATP-binding protein